MKRKLRLGLGAIIFLGAANLSAQIALNAPVPADNPNLGGDSPWPAVCAGNSGFNQFYATVSWAGAPNAGNEFILELSDANGDFGNPVELARSSNNAEVQDPGFEFSIPTDTRGEGYRLRVRTTDPATTGPPSDSYNMYFMDVTTNLNISSDGNGIPQGSLCSTDPITLQVDNIANPETYQYIWFRSGSVVSGEKSHTLSVIQSGMYYAYIDYGPICTGSGNTDSNIVDITIGAGGQGIAIAPPTTTALCNGDTETLAIDTTDPAWSYQWYKDDSAIPGAVGTSFTVNAGTAGFEGDYQVEISAPGICTERSNPVSITNADNFAISLTNPDNLVLLPSQTETLGVTTDAISPSYQWYRNGSTFGGDASTLDVTQAGTYYVAITQGGGSCPGTVKNSDTITVVAPDSIELVIDFPSGHNPCTDTNTQVQVTAINALLSDNSSLDVTADVAANFSYQWALDGADVTGATTNGLGLTDTSENGVYTVSGNLGSYAASSNSLTVQLATNETLAIESTGTVYCSGGATITLSTTTDLSTSNYEWQRDGVAINSSDSTLIVDQTGAYRLVVDRGGCPLISNEITISPLDANLITLDVEGDVIFPEGSSRTVTASGATAYRWLNADNVEIANTSSFTFTEEGTYLLIATIDNCDVSRPITVSYLDTFKVPNVITPNADGFNDQWVLPNSYANKNDVSVIIYDDKGVEVLNSAGYQNNWPESSMTFPKQNMVFYYIIKNAQETLKQGTITVIR